MKRIFGTVLVILLTGCSANSGEEYIGRWVHTKAPNVTLTIERNGDAFILREVRPSFLDGKMKTQNIPAIYKDGMLQIATDFGTKNYAIDRASGNLSAGRSEYRRLEQ